MEELEFQVVYTHEDSRTFRAEVPLVQVPNKVSVVNSPLPVYLKTGGKAVLVGHALVEVNGLGELVARLYLDYATPERLDFDNGESFVALPLLGKMGFSVSALCLERKPLPDAIL